MGGGFGGKESQATQWAAIAALAARVTGRPCKIRLDRDDDMILTGKRHDFLADYEVGFDDEGRIRGARTVHGVALRLFGGPVGRRSTTARCSMPTTPITCRPRPSPTKRLKTNTVSNTAFRGFGGPQGMMVVERAIDEIAWALGLDPLDVRKRNLYRAGPRRHALRHGGRGQHRCRR